MRNRLVLPLLLTILFFSVGSYAIEMEGLYTVEIEVSDRNRETRLDAHKKALKEVFVRISGNIASVHHPKLTAAINNAGRYVQQYQYKEETTIQKSNVLESSDLEIKKIELKKLYLVDLFDRHAVEKLLKESELPIWGSSRPSTLVWLAIEENGQRQIISANDRGVVKDIIANAAKYRAIPVRLPLLDLIDHNKITVADIWGGFVEVILDASARYQSQAVLIGKLFQDKDELWQVDWKLFQGKESQHWQSKSGAVELLIASGLNTVADRLSIQYAQRFDKSGLGQFDIVVEPVQSFEEIESVRKYLTNINGIKNVRMLQISANSVRFMLNVEGQIDAVMQTISLGNLLSLQESELSPVEPDSDVMKQHKEDSWKPYEIPFMSYRYIHH